MPIPNLRSDWMTDEHRMLEELTHELHPRPLGAEGSTRWRDARA